MTKNLLIVLILGFGTTLYCQKNIEFESNKFKLPMSIKEAIVMFETGKNSPYRAGGIDNRQILLHENIKGDSIVGITFYRKCKTQNELLDMRNKYFSAFENEYQSEFKAIDFSFFTSLDGKYYILPAGKNLLVLGDVMYNRADNNYVTVTYFTNMDKEMISGYLNKIY